MKWTPKEISRLRKSLNWSKEQLSRRLSCTVELIKAIELGQEGIGEEISFQLQQLKNQSESISEQRRKRPQAEQIMQEYGLLQIDKELIDELIEKE